MSTDFGTDGLSLAGGIGDREGVGREGGAEAVGRNGREGGGRFCLPLEGGGWLSDSSYCTGGGRGVCTGGGREGVVRREGERGRGE